MNLFKKGRRKYTVLKTFNQEVIENAPILPDGLWIKCNKCSKTIYTKSLNKYKICPHCNYLFRLTAFERLNLIADENSFVEQNKNMISKNPLDYPDYENKILKTINQTGINDAVITGICKIHNINTYICIMDGNFIMGSMGSVVGEKLTRAFEYSTNNNLPIIVFTVSGGARMQEGILSLMQMAKVSGAVSKHNEKGLLYVSVLTDPTTGGVSASFAMLADIILSEPKALIGFAGRRVIEQTIKQTIPENFQTAEFQFENGFLDDIVKREDLRNYLGKILYIHSL